MILTFLHFTITKSKISVIQKSLNETEILSKTFDNIKSENEKWQKWFEIEWQHSVLL
jgi:hypothetical protein